MLLRRIVAYSRLGGDGDPLVRLGVGGVVRRGVGGAGSLVYSRFVMRCIRGTSLAVSTNVLSDVVDAGLVFLRLFAGRRCKSLNTWLQLPYTVRALLKASSLRISSR